MLNTCQKKYIVTVKHVKTPYTLYCNICNIFLIAILSLLQEFHFVKRDINRKIFISNLNVLVVVLFLKEE